MSDHLSPTLIFHSISSPDGKKSSPATLCVVGVSDVVFDGVIIVVGGVVFDVNDVVIVVVVRFPFEMRPFLSSSAPTLPSYSPTFTSPSPLPAPLVVSSSLGADPLPSRFEPIHQLRDCWGIRPSQPRRSRRYRCRHRLKPVVLPRRWWRC